MIQLNRVTKLIGRKDRRRLVLNEVDWTIPLKSHLAILSVQPVDCTTLLDIISGAQFPTSGWVDRRCTVLSPTRIMRAASGILTPRQAISRLARIYGARAKTLIDFVEDFADLGQLMNEPIKLFPKPVHYRFSAALVYGIPSDFYLFNGRVHAGPPEIRERCREAFDTRRRQAGMILATSQARIAREFGGMIGILHEGQVYLSEDPDGALAAFERLVLAGKRNISAELEAPPPEEPDAAGIDLLI